MGELRLPENDFVVTKALALLIFFLCELDHIDDLTRDYAIILFLLYIVFGYHYSEHFSSHELISFR